MDNLWIIYGYGWWLTYPSKKYEFVHWDDDIPNIWENKSHVPNRQPTGILWFISMVISMVGSSNIYGHP